FVRADQGVRAGVMCGLGQMFYKRSFSLLARGLRDADAGVREAALEALRKLHFPHAFDSLVRIFRESSDERVRAAALESIGEVGALEAGEFLIGVLRHESEPLRRLAQKLLARFENPEIVSILRSYLENQTRPARAPREPARPPIPRPG